jgi:hypothetical protein
LQGLLAADPAIRRLTRGRGEFAYYPGMIETLTSAPNFKNKS